VGASEQLHVALQPLLILLDPQQQKVGLKACSLPEIPAACSSGTDRVVVIPAVIYLTLLNGDIERR
jgi:hypothetical protein